mgnify:CR=1 FL=1
MKRNFFLGLLLFIMGQAYAIDVDHLRELGLPADAVPAISYFEHLFEKTVPVTEQDYYRSSHMGIGDEYFLFVEKLPSKEDDDFDRINIWMYTTQTEKVTKIFSQEGSEHSGLLIEGIDMLTDKQSTFIEHEVADSKQKIQLQDFVESPVVVLNAEEFCGTAHAPRVTLLVYPYEQKVKELSNEQFVCIFHTLTNMLMNAEMELAQDYILTTDTEVQSESLPLEESQEVTIYLKQYLTPSLHIYTAKGEKVQSVTLPVDEVDMVR